MATNPNQPPLNASGSPVNRDHRGMDTLAPSRRLMALVNADPSFTDATRHLGLFPQKLYTMIQQTGIARVKQVCDFVVSIVTETPSFFYVDKQGRYDPSLEGVRTRARNMAISLALSPSKPILEKYAGALYFKRWGKSE